MPRCGVALAGAKAEEKDVQVKILRRAQLSPKLTTPSTRCHRYVGGARINIYTESRAKSGQAGTPRCAHNFSLMRFLPSESRGF